MAKSCFRVGVFGKKKNIYIYIYMYRKQTGKTEIGGKFSISAIIEISNISRYEYYLRNASISTFKISSRAYATWQ
ncbi:hypothetical protein EUGRSUZ_H00115 [Eucalyptus grandis]|uniref:Uncharacterized protein n=2 Tax=Eucalyptus grandis TaxID=71139 RepID=A0ACC3JLE9_EUCGR|nr:hypothetical protein EUGRSUZ_H00115 [Eucalyptus grandis]